MLIRVLLAGVLLFAACAKEASDSSTASNTSARPAPDTRAAGLHNAMAKVEPFFKRMGKPQPADWLTAFHEDGQTFDQWLASSPTLPTPDRRTIYVLPLGDFTKQQKRIIKITAGYLEAFYGLPVSELKQRPLDAEFPNVRHSKLLGTRQVKTGYLLSTVLPPLLPSDGAALIAFTDQDLYPDEAMSYVFGQASLDRRVGVWSLLRLKDASFERYLRRTIKIATHETGHMFSIKHCIAYECVMSGSNHIGETDRRPIDACPECMAKVSWLSGVDPVARYRKLAQFCEENGLEADARDFNKKAEALR